MTPLDRAFYSREPAAVARGLLGKRLARKIDGITMSGVIIETEAYGSSDDPASHAHRGMTGRNRAMFGEVGRAYVYFTYGMHYCMNVVARRGRSDAGAVLIRAIRPELGAAQMSKNRNGRAAISDGPAKLTQAMRISAEQYGEDLTRRGALYIAEGPRIRSITASPRVGIRRGTDLLWNFKVK
ncbi:3-methyladenine DNA glycosylase [Cenarchaeum symbiosum A]|uniref:Putative 3-methyladenine DNA glycosylase n=1 Tax=Cenarchaeum symbiosum (strain A) TaxID=414004 RepID=A0RV65_CENSY|nr:3-methyladenine DNA glycosylase [Cenarchaeum symbiosum A]